MKSHSVIRALLSAVNDGTVTHSYGDGVLVDLPLTYGDGDTVRLLVEPLGDGFRISDRAAAFERLHTAEVNTDQGRAAQALAATIRAAGLTNVGGAEDEIATFGVEDDLGRLVLSVAQASMRVEQLRWLAVKRQPIRFQDRVVARLQKAARRDWQVLKNAPIRLTSGRERPVTAAVSHGAEGAYVQALSASDPDGAAEHCHYLFSLAADRNVAKVAALSGTPDTWSTALVEELQGVAMVEFFDAPGQLEHAVERALVSSGSGRLV